MPVIVDPNPVPLRPATSADNVHHQINSLQAACLFVASMAITKGVPWLADHVADLAQFGQIGQTIGLIATAMVAAHLFGAGQPALVPTAPPKT